MISGVISCHTPALQGKIQEFIYNDSDSKKLLGALNTGSNSKRYSYRSHDPKKACFTAVFEGAFKKKPEVLIRLAQENSSSWKSCYPTWKKVCLIQLPNNISKITGNRTVKLVASVAITCIFLVCACVAFLRIKQLTTIRAVPFIINNAPIEVIRVGNVFFRTVDWVIEHPFTTTGCAYVARLLLSYVPNDTAQKIARRINPTHFLFFLLSDKTAEFLIPYLDSTYNTGWIGLQKISDYFNDIARRADIQRRQAAKPQVRAFWENSIKQYKNV